MRCLQCFVILFTTEVVKFI